MIVLLSRLGARCDIVPNAQAVRETDRKPEGIYPTKILQQFSSHYCATTLHGSGKTGSWKANTSATVKTKGNRLMTRRYSTSKFELFSATFASYNDTSFTCETTTQRY